MPRSRAQASPAPLPRAPARSLVLLVGAVLAALLASAAPATAGPRAETSIMDDQLLLNESRDAVDGDMAAFRTLGVDRVRVSAFWSQIAPAPTSETRPAGFDASNPSSPGYSWRALDDVVDSAVRHGFRVMVSISTPVPVWASADPARNNQLWKPKANEFGDFAAAVVRRYGSVVDHWGAANEPNVAAWLQPQSGKSGLIAPHLYRAMVQSAYPRIKALDPTSVVLVGELAASGRSGRGATRGIRPLLFLREMACRNKKWKPIRSGRCRNFKPIPLDAVGHHPYQLLLAPTRRSANRYDAAIGDGRRLLRTLDRLSRLKVLTGGRGRRLSVYYTEFGYQTSPPDPFAGVSLAQQRLYLQQAAYAAYKTPRVKGLNQFRLTDGAIVGSGLRRFAEFQSGLMFRDRRKKPAYAVFPNPFVITKDRFWGQVRPGGEHSVRVLRAAERGAPWRLVAQVRTNTKGYFNFRLPGRRAGYYRYTYTSPSGASATLRVRR